jgi:hypothetical protein
MEQDHTQGMADEDEWDGDPDVIPLSPTMVWIYLITTYLTRLAVALVPFCIGIWAIVWLHNHGHGGWAIVIAIFSVGGLFSILGGIFSEARMTQRRACSGSPSSESSSPPL